MTSRDFAYIVFKAMGLYWLVSAILHIIHGALMPFSDIGGLPGNVLRIEITNWILTGALYGLLSYVLIFRTPSALSLLKLKIDKEEQTTSSIPAIDYRRLSFAVLGAYFLVPAISAIIPQIITVLSLRKPTPAAEMFQTAYLEKSWTGLLENSIQFVIGVIMVLGRTRLTQLWLRLRPLSTSIEDDSEIKE